MMIVIGNSSARLPTQTSVDPFLDNWPIIVIRALVPYLKSVPRVPEIITGLIGVSLIALGFRNSLRRNASLAERGE